MGAENALSSVLERTSSSGREAVSIDLTEAHMLRHTITVHANAIRQTLYV